MHLVASDEGPKVQPQLIVGTSRNMVELIHSDQPVVERLHPKPVHREAESGMGADQHLVVALKEAADRIDLAAIGAGRIAKIPLRLHPPVGPKTELGQRLVMETRADAPFRHDDDGLFQPLIGQFVQRDEHERAALAGRRGRLNKQILLAALLIGALLHRAHPKGVGLGRTAGLGIRHRDGRNGFHFFRHELAPALRFFVTPADAVILV